MGLAVALEFRRALATHPRRVSENAQARRSALKSVPLWKGTDFEMEEQAQRSPLTSVPNQGMHLLRMDNLLHQFGWNSVACFRGFDPFQLVQMLVIHSFCQLKSKG